MPSGAAWALRLAEPCQELCKSFNATPLTLTVSHVPPLASSTVFWHRMSVLQQLFLVMQPCLESGMHCK